MQYRIFNKKRKTYLDANLYYVTQKGKVMKINSPLPILASNQEDLEVRLVEESKNEEK